MHFLARLHFHHSLERNVMFVTLFVLWRILHPASLFGLHAVFHKNSAIQGCGRSEGLVRILLLTPLVSEIEMREIITVLRQ